MTGNLFATCRRWIPSTWRTRLDTKTAGNSVPCGGTSPRLDSCRAGGSSGSTTGHFARAARENTTHSRWGARTIPFTWVLLIPKNETADTSPNQIVVCSTHLEAGHDWNEDCPAKRNSARCVRACVGRLQQWFGCNTHIVVGGDFNAQKTQLHRRLLTGEGAGIFRNMKLDDPTVAARIGDGASQKTKPGYEASAPGAAIGNGGPNDPNVDSSDDESNSNGDTNDWSPPSGHKSWDNRWDLVDVFDALKEDNPCSSVGDALDHGVLSGGHRGTTWHNWRGPDWACMISSIMAKSGKHHSQLTFAHGGEREKNTGKTRGPPKSSDGAVQHGGGFSGSIGGLGTEAEPDTRAVGAVGNQRHIDHIYVARGDGIRDTSRLDKQPRVRVVRARVVTNSASEDVRVSGEARCACGFAASAVWVRGECEARRMSSVWRRRGGRVHSAIAGSGEWKV